MTDHPEVKSPHLNDGANLTGRVKLTDEEIAVIKIQFNKDTDYPRFDALVREYCRFLELKLSNSTIPMAPSALIDKIWHAHILSTREYLAFCRRHNQGEFLHHDPAMKQGQLRYQITLEGYEEVFGEKPDDQDIWPGRADQKPTKKRLRALKAEAQPESRAETHEAGKDQEDQKPKKKAKLDKSEDGKASAKQEGKDEAKVQTNRDGRTEAQANESVETDSDDEYDSDGYNADQREYLKYNKDKGATPEELVLWHEAFVKDAAEKEGFDPNECAQCLDGHFWIEGDFDLDCESCREHSAGIGEDHICG